MDSMKSLNTSLPTTDSARGAPPEQLLQAFRAAALSVTNLYKASVNDQSNSRQAGYQDALDDLLDFLDRENLGLQDGEGWRVRQWATERYDGTAGHDVSTGKVKDEADPRVVTEGTSHSREQMVGTDPDSDPSTSEPDEIQISQIPYQEPMYQFTAGREKQETNVSHRPSSMSVHAEQNSSSPSTTDPTIFLQLSDKSSPSSPSIIRQRHVTRSSGRGSTSVSSTKRKLHFPDFFDISSDGTRDGGIGSKRSRVV